ncbi:insulinase family protein [Kribbella sp. NPDC023972]|uniref:M16 family metallopeptidase n=1 Tax=Kribbella sp. NPDC023972 TaxID=3154795 RepID=UPI003402FF9F
MSEYIDGVRVLRHSGTQSHTDITLTFAVGSRDETLRTVGVAHALEHLVMHSVRGLPIEMNAEVDLMTTTFVASGSSARVGEFLDRLCRALAEPPVERLALEAGVLAAEDGRVAHPVVAQLLNVRYGAKGPGLAWLEGPGYDGLKPEHVTAFAQAWFVPSNAVLQVTGPLPDDLQLKLPSGSAPTRIHPAGRSFDGPTVVGEGIPAAGVLLTLPPDNAVRQSTLTIDVLRHRVEEECRHVRGHSYDVGADLVAGPGGTSDWVVYAEARDGSEAEVSRAFVEALTDLTENGPTEAELAYQIARWQERLDADEPELRRTFGNTMGRMFGEPELEPVDRERLAGLRPSEVAAVLKAALPTAIGYAYEDAGEVWEQAGFRRGSICPVTPDVPAGKTFKPPFAARAFVKEARSMLWVRTDTALVLRDDDGVHEIRWDEIAGVMRTHDGTTIVLGLNGCAIPVDPDMFRGAATLLTELSERVPQDLWFDETKLGPADD